MIQYCIFFIQQTKSTKKDTCMFSYMYNNNTKGIEIKLNIVCAYMHHHICWCTHTQEKKMNQKPNRQKELNKILIECKKKKEK